MHRMARLRVRRLLFLSAGLAALVFLATAAAIVIDGLRDEIGPADIAVVLGSKVELDGKPSARLRARLDRALELHRSGLAPRILVSGGIGVEGFDEAAVMREYLLSRGVPAERVHVDPAGSTTLATARNAARFLSAGGWKSAVLVSQYFHLPRARLALRRCGVSTVYTAHAAYFELRDLYSTAREVLAFYAYLLLSSP
jgi:vancomycin permeability regulator SanA